ncbi:unnamed protein product [Enterobius vermicularis]|uniref:Laminin EGF-like domain-containing protein n=1 Tax=Enterobius vermicularis TaxID=51028 RepID=A0A3P6I3G2_ENTVE|nr:unnamed protein product [Enterobius vermicularis]
MRIDDPDGCRPCTCHLFGTYNNEGCDKVTGKCTCKGLVTGENCDQCLPEHYGLSEEFSGCKPCDCVIGGAYDNNCDVISGQCKCRPNFSGRRCDTADSSFYCPSIDHYTYEAENANITRGDVVQKELPLHARDRKWTGEGVVRVYEGSTLSFQVNNLAQSMNYGIIIRYELPPSYYGWENVEIAVVRPSNLDPNGPCSGAAPSDDFLIVRLQPDRQYVEVSPYVCLEKGKSYEIRIAFGNKRSDYSDRSAYVFIDSIVLAPPATSLQVFQGSYVAERHRDEFTRYHCRNQALALTPITDLPEACLRYICPVAGSVFNQALKCNCDPTGSKSNICAPKGGQCECKTNVVGRKCDRCAVGTFGFGPSGCTACACDSVGSLNNVCDRQSGQCLCRERGITGRQCNQCQPGFWDFPTCRVCQCNGHASICDQVTGVCIDCRDLTDGRNCERCKNGYYGDPRLGANIPCKPCPCPKGPESGCQHADSCYLKSFDTKEVVCNCREGYVGERCNACDVNYWGTPNEVGGTCERCECNGNIDYSVEGSCDPVTGDCLKCLHNTEGTQCENCIEGYFGDAKIRSCERCVCNRLGTDASGGACDRVTGQCVCLPNVTGQQCDACAPLHYNLASGKGCEACDCDPTGVSMREDGSLALQCNQFDGRCPCKRGRGGRTCSECEDFYWGDPKAGECHRCECDPSGSASQQCHRTNGTCICLPGSGGPSCNECARGYTGRWPYCEACGECFTNWDSIIQELRKQVEELIDRANSIEDTGVGSVYDDVFERTEEILKNIKAKLESANITKQDTEKLQEEIEGLAEKLNQGVIETSASCESAWEELEKLLKKADELTRQAQELNENGAYNITYEAADRSAAAKARAAKANELIKLAENERNKAEEMLEKNERDFQKQFDENEAALKEIGSQMSTLEKLLPGLNKDVCGAESADCDELCGGPGDCGHCGGGGSCLQGSVTKAKQALVYVNETGGKLDEKQRKAEGLKGETQRLLSSASITKNKASKGHEVALEAAKMANNTKEQLEAILKETDSFLNEERSSPEQIRARAQEVLDAQISLTPEEIKELGDKIHKLLRNIDNIDDILAETKGNKTIAAALQRQAEKASEKASLIRNNMDTVKNEAKAAEELIQKTNKSWVNLENQMQKIRLKYLEVSKEAGRANEDAVEVMEKAESSEKAVEDNNEQLETARELLSEKQKGNEKKQARAEELKKRATRLLDMVQKQQKLIKELNDSVLAADVRIDDYVKKIDGLNDRIGKVSEEINTKINFHNSCDK